MANFNEKARKPGARPGTANSPQPSGQRVQNGRMARPVQAVRAVRAQRSGR